MKGAPLAQVSSFPLATAKPAAYDDPLSALLEQHGGSVSSQNQGLEKSTKQAEPQPDPVIPKREDATSKTGPSLQDCVDTFLSACSHSPPNPEAVAPTIGGLRLLARMRAWKNVENMAKQLLEREPNDDVFVCYFLSLLKIGRPPFTKLQEELSAFLKQKMLEGHDNTSKTMLTLRLLQIETSKYPEGATQDPAIVAASSDKCLEELRLLKKELNDNDLTWIGQTSMIRIGMAIVNTALSRANWPVALAMLEELRCRGGVPVTDKLSVLSYDLEILSRIGNVFLQMGNLEEASLYFDRAEAVDLDRRRFISSSRNVPLEAQVSSPRSLLNSGLLIFARNDFKGAIRIFQKVIELEQTRQREQQLTFAPIGGSSGSFQHAPAAGAEGTDYLFNQLCGLDVQENLMVEAVNNFSICSMYMCEVGAAVTCLEKLIADDPTSHMVDCVIFNLSTLYELSNDVEATNMRKQVLKEVATKFCLHDIAELSFRITAR